MRHIKHLTTPDPIWRPYTFDRVTVSTSRGPLLSLLGKCYSRYRSGPSLLSLADAACEIAGPGWYGLFSARYVGFRTEAE